MLIDLRNFLGSLYNVLSCKTCLNRLVLQFIQWKAFAIELFQPNLSIEFVGAEDEVPALDWSASWSFGLGLHVFGVNHRLEDLQFGFLLLIYRNHL